ncbi:MAG: hypothetical protein RMJ59_01600 [Candidatus Nitrosocaldus sp.]|nr:hypothetical protein [Candidatus Nitrosocaldus sp.]MDW8275060.1 hypothetical protein [Candidatus Nitrosocaldus sp.]
MGLNIFRLIRLLFSKEVKEPFYIALGNLSSSILAAVFWLVMASIIEPRVYGEVNYYIAIASLAAALSLLALDTTSTSLIAKGKKHFFREALLLESLLSITAAVTISLIFSNAIIAFIVIGTNLLAMMLAYMLGIKMYNTYPIIAISNRAIQAILSIILYFVMGSDGILVGFAISSLVLGSILLSKFRLNGDDNNDQKKITQVIKLNNIKAKKKFILSTYTLHLAGAKLLFIDKIVIAPMFGFEVLGLYQLGFQLLMFLAVIPSSLLQYLVPEESSNTERRIVKWLGLMLCVIVALVFYLTSPFLINIFFPKYVDAIDNAKIMSLGVIPMTINSIIVSSLIAREKSSVVLLGSLVYICSLIPLFILLGNIIGLIGLGLSVVLALSLQTITLILSTRYIIKPS